MAISVRQRVMLASAPLVLLACTPLVLWLPPRLDGLSPQAIASEPPARAREALLSGFSAPEDVARGRPARLLVGALAGSILAFGLAGAWLLGSFLVRPLERVTAVAERIAAGDEAAADDLPALAGDEVGAMAAALARTFEELRRRRSRVAEMNRELSAIIEDRAVELVRANIALADLRFAQEHRGERFDLIVCDLVMPSMNGMELLAALGSATPEQAARMVFVTGGVFTDAGRRFLDAMNGRWLPKPVDVDLLDRLVNSRLA